MPGWKALIEWNGVYRPEEGAPGMGVRVRDRPVGLDVGVWAQLCREDPVRALGLAVEEHGDCVLRLVYLRLGDRQVAERVAEETFLRAARLAPGARTTCSLGAWLASLALGLCRSVARRRGARGCSGRCGPPSGEERLLDAMRGLPSRSAELILMHYWSGYGVEEIAALWGVPPATVRAGLRAAVSLLKRRLGRTGRSLPGGLEGTGDENGFLQRDSPFEQEGGLSVGPE